MAKSKDAKIFVLDTSVILYSHDSIMNFEEHDIGIPITVLEELDHFKKGNDIKNFEAREFIRLIDSLAKDHMLNDWIPLNGKTRGSFKVIMNPTPEVDAEKIFDDPKPDHKILNAALSLKEQEKNRSVILVSKDINLRLKAKSLKLAAEDYQTGKIKNINSLYTGKTIVDDVLADFINDLYKSNQIDRKKVLKRKKTVCNSYFILKSEKNSILAYENSVTKMIEKVDKRFVSSSNKCNFPL